MLAVFLLSFCLCSKRVMCPNTVLKAAVIFVFLLSDLDGVILMSVDCTKFAACWWS